VRDKVNVIEEQLEGERATSLGEAGKKLEEALAALDGTDERIEAAANAVWEYMIIRESVNLYGHQIALSYYNVPDRVMARVGVIKRSS
jgi:hypothetical protein